MNRNPRAIKGAGVEHAPERPIATMEQVYELADIIEPRPRLMVLLGTFASLRQGSDGLLFCTRDGDPIRKANLHRTGDKARIAVSLDPLHFHDLNHTGNTMAATGASTAELMARLSHSSSSAALIYQHATRERDKQIADALVAAIIENRERDGRRRSA